jgi:hypothetical protein
MAQWFNYRGYSDDPHIKKQAEHLLALMLMERKRQPNSRDRSEYLRCMTVALAGLQLSGAYQLNDIYVPLNIVHYNGKTRRNPIYRSKLLKCFRWLIASDYLFKTKNHSYNESTGYARPATYQLSQKWLEMAVQFPPPPPGSISRNPESPFIELRNEDGKALPLVIHHERSLWEDRLKAYDDRTQRHVFERLGVRLDPVLFSLTRIFSRSSYEKGGRYYSAFQQFPSLQRQQLMIDGKPVVEIDYKSLHPSLLYQEVGLECPEDSYTIAGFDRPTVKRSFNILINRSKPDDCWRSFCYFLGMKKEAAMDLETALRALHSPIERFFGTGKGLELQHYDSLLCEAVIDYMVTQAHSIVVPIHDSFIVKETDLEWLSEALQYAEVTAAKKTGRQPRNPVLLESEALGKGAFTDQALRKAFPGIERTTWTEIEDGSLNETAQSKAQNEARMEGYLEDSVIEND